jgi:hypothetical protein
VIANGMPGTCSNNSWWNRRHPLVDPVDPIIFFHFFWPQLQKNHWKTLIFTLSCTRQTAGWRIHIAFGRRPKKKNETYTWSSQPVKWQAGWLHPCRPAGQVPCTVAGKWFSTNSKKWHQTKLSHRRPAPAPSFRFPIRA